MSAAVPPATSVQPYRVEPGTIPPATSGTGWDVVGPDGVAGSVTYLEQEDAEAHAADLNVAYELGRGAGIVEAGAIAEAAVEAHSRRIAELERQVSIARGALEVANTGIKHLTAVLRLSRLR